jgi:hypothetical protein
LVSKTCNVDDGFDLCLLGCKYAFIKRDFIDNFVIGLMGRLWCWVLKFWYPHAINVLNLHKIDLARKYHTHLQREIEKEEAREKEWKNYH